MPIEAVVYEVTHSTEYAYDRIIRSSDHALRLKPVQDASQHLLAFSLQMEPRPRSQQTLRDGYGNEVLHLNLRDPYQTMRMESRSRVLVRAPERDLARAAPWPLVWPRREWEALQHLMIPDPLPEPQLRLLSDYAHTFRSEQNEALIPTIDAITQAIFQNFRYQPGSTVIGTSVFEVFERRQGVCQDFANLMIGLLRLLQLPARYRTGYIHPGDGVPSADASQASHAWVEVYVPEYGWCGWDPTNGKRVGLDHIRVAAGQNSFEATPTSGTIHTPFQNETLTVHVKVQKCEEGDKAHEL